MKVIIENKRGSKAHSPEIQKGVTEYQQQYSLQSDYNENNNSKLSEIAKEYKLKNLRDCLRTQEKQDYTPLQQLFAKRPTLHVK